MYSAQVLHLPPAGIGKSERMGLKMQLPMLQCRGAVIHQGSGCGRLGAGFGNGAARRAALLATC